MTTETTLASIPFADLPVIGHPFEGGHYGGIILVHGRRHAVVQAPKASGEIIDFWHPEYTDVPGAASCFDSMANTIAMADAGSPVAQRALAASIGGFTDWCIPARDVVELTYRRLKPTHTINYSGYRDGDNASSVPPGYPYTKQCPAQTTAEAFKAGASEAFEPEWYFSSTQYSQYDAWVQDFHYGFQGVDSKPYSRRVRFVRLIQLDA